MKLKKKKIVSFLLAMVMIVTTFSEVNLNVRAADGIEYHGRVSYGGSTVGHFTVNGQIAFCAEHNKTSPSTGSSFHDEIYGNEDIKKVLYYGWGGTEQWAGFESEEHGIVATSLVLSHYYSGTSIKTACKSFYDWLQTQPNAPTTDISLSKSSFESYVEDNIQRTENITLNGDSRNVVVFPLPDGVTLHNVSSGAVQTGSVGVRCGETFFLTAPLSMNTTWNSGVLKSTMREYQPVISYTVSESLQNLVRLRTSDPSASIDLTVKWSAVGYLEIQKTDSTTGQALAGAVYGIYRDSNCTDLAEQLTLDNSGHGLSGQLVAGRYYVREITAPIGYKLDTTVYTCDVPAGQTVRVGAKDERVTGSITITKTDKETGKAQGDAILKGAVYGLYAANDIVHPDGITGTLYYKDQLIMRFPGTDEAGKATLNDLYLGNMYIKEISPSPGYLLDETKYPVTLSYQGQNVSVVTTSKTVKEQVIKGRIQLVKHLQEPLKPSANKKPQKPEKGAEFQIILKSTGKIVQTITTDSDGFAISDYFPWGTYIVHQNKGKDGYELMDDFEVMINADGRTYSYILENVHYSANLKVVKTDAETGETVAVAGATFQILNSEGNLVEQDMYYPERKKISEFTTDKDGTLMLPEQLVYGDYMLVETSAPDGYLLAEPIPFTVSKAELTTDEWGDEVVVVNCSDIPVKGKIKIEKTGKVLTGFKNGKFIYEETGLEGCVFRITAAETIYSPDHATDEEGNRRVLYKKGEVVEELTTDENGKAETGRLWLGKYQVEEISAPDGFLKESEVQEIELKYKDQLTELVFATDTVYDENQEFQILVEKTDGTTKEPLEGTEFTLYAAQDIFNANGDVIVKKDSKIAVITTNEEGKTRTAKNLPVNVYVGEKDKPMYYLMETGTPKGYVTDNSKYNILGKAGEGEKLTIRKEKITNIPIQVSFLKEDMKGNPLSGATLSVKEKDSGFLGLGENVMNTWVTDGKEYIISNLEAGKTYILEEIEAPEGYTIAEPIEFTVEDTEEVQKIVMEDKVADGKIKLHKMEEDTGKDLAGAVFELRNETGEVLETMTTDSEGKAESGTYPIGIYENGEFKFTKFYLVEVTAPEGHILDSIPHEITFKWKDGTELLIETEVNVTNKATEGKLPQTGEFPIGKVLTGAGILCVTGAFIMWRKGRKKDKVKKGQHEE